MQFTFRNKSIAVYVFCFCFLLVSGSNEALYAQKKGSSKTPPPTRSRHFSKRTFKSSDQSSIDYWVMSPESLKDGKTYPLVLALHGRGGNTVAATQLGSDSLRRKFPCYVVAPVSTNKGHWLRPEKSERRRKRNSNTQPMLVTALAGLDDFIKNHPIDKNRIYVTGQSMGGAGTYGALSLRPDYFAAAIPVCGGWEAELAGKIKTVPIWIFHGEKDRVVPTEYSRNMFAALKKAGGTPKYTEYKDVGHGSWSKAYASPETWAWLFQQKRK